MKLQGEKSLGEFLRSLTALLIKNAYIISSLKVFSFNQIWLSDTVIPFLLKQKAVLYQKSIFSLWIILGCDHINLPFAKLLPELLQPLNARQVRLSSQAPVQSYPGILINSFTNGEVFIKSVWDFLFFFLLEVLFFLLPLSTHPVPVSWLPRQPLLAEPWVQRWIFSSLSQEADMKDGGTTNELEQVRKAQLGD